MQFLIAFGFILLIVVLFVGSYVLNNRTEKPDIEVDMAGCGGCHNINCGHNPARNDVKEEK